MSELEGRMFVNLLLHLALATATLRGTCRDGLTGGPTAPLRVTCIDVLPSCTR